ncbi:MAG: 50S ribosomal protein L3 [Chlamydiales bacterium]|nr:50S ribosomal protein L3 [Chlamydiia bacterium]MCP5503826.1 50S ribosomal protein L3 [Chlamydiales bacterium]
MSLKLMGKKKGMTRIYDEKGNLIVCTVIAAEPNVIVQVKDKDKDGYQAIQLGAIKVPESKKKNLSKPLVGHFARAKVEPRRHLLESRIENTEEFQLGQEIGIDYFSDTEFVDVCGTSKGKGFQGVIKRHNFGGGPGAHGSGFHRTAGSTGMRSTPGRSLPGVKKAGQMGSQKVTTENLKVVRVDAEKQIILVKGAVPGAKNSLLYIRKSVKKTPAKK